jgi:hypothetical protein
MELSLHPAISQISFRMFSYAHLYLEGLVEHYGMIPAKNWAIFRVAGGRGRRDRDAPERAGTYPRKSRNGHCGECVGVTAVQFKLKKKKYDTVEILTLWFVTDRAEFTGHKTFRQKIISRGVCRSRLIMESSRSRICYNQRRPEGNGSRIVWESFQVQ